jgi:hypothetical protein
MVLLWCAPFFGREELLRLFFSADWNRLQTTTLGMAARGGINNNEPNPVFPRDGCTKDSADNQWKTKE